MCAMEWKLVKDKDSCAHACARVPVGVCVCVCASCAFVYKLICFSAGESTHVYGCICLCVNAHVEKIALGIFPLPCVFETESLTILEFVSWPESPRNQADSISLLGMESVHHHSWPIKQM